MSDYSINATIGADDSGFDKAINKSIAGLEKFASYFEKAGEEAKQSFTGIANQFTAIDAKAKVWGNTTDVIADKQRALKNEINSLIDKGLTPEDAKIKALKTSYDNLGKAQDASTTKTKNMWTMFATMRDVMQGPIAALQMMSSALSGIGSATIGQASKIEDMVAAFTPLTGSAENAKEMVAALNKEAATTPFELEGIGRVAKQLLPVFGNDVGAVTEQFRMLGDTAGGNIEKLDTITRGYMKTMLKGKADMESMNMIAEAGVPIYTELADSMGISVEEMMKMSSAGKITAADMTNAFRSMTSEGGIFFNGMNVASQTFSGKLSTLSDNVKQSGAAIGNVFLPAAKGMLDIASSITGAFTKWATEGDNLATVFKMIVAVGLSVALAAIVSQVPAIVAAFAAMKTAIMSFNTAALFGPTGIIIGIGLLVAALIAVGSAVNKSQLKEIEKDFSNLTKEAGLSAEKIKKVQDELRVAQTENGNSFDKVLEDITDMADRLGVSKEQVIQIGLQSQKIGPEYKKALAAVKEWNEALKESNKYVIGTKEWIAAQSKAAEKSKEITTELKGESEDLAKTRIKWANEAAEAEIYMLERARDAEISSMQESGATSEQIYNTRKYYDDKILQIRTDRITKEMNSDLDAARAQGASAKTLADIKKSYEIEITELKDTQEKERTSITKKGTDDQTKVIKNSVKDYISAFGTVGSALSEAFGGGATAAINSLTNIGLGMVSVFETGGTSVTAWAGLAASLIGGIAQLFGGTSARAEYAKEKAEQARKAAEEAAKALDKVLTSGTSSYEDFLGAAQIEHFKERVAGAFNAARIANEEYQKIYDQAYTQRMNQIMSETQGSAKLADAQKEAAKSAAVFASLALQKSQDAQKLANTMQYVYDTVYAGNIVTSKSSSILDEWANSLDDVVQTYGSASTEVQALNEYYQQLLYQAMYPAAAALEDNKALLEDNISLWKNAGNAVNGFNTQLSNLVEAASSFYKSFGNIGSDLAGSLIDAFTNGLDEKGFMDSMKEYILNMVIQAQVYTGALQAKIASIGQQIAEGIASGYGTDSWGSVITQLKEVYATAASYVSAATSVVESAFSGYATGTDYASEGWHTVGERGPERVYLSQGSQVVNAVDTNMGSGQGKQVTVNANFYSPKAMNQAEQLTALRQYNRELAFEGVI